MDVFDVRHGFGFSAGLFDYVLNYGLSTRGWVIIPFGAMYFGVYYVVFRWFIVRFNVPTPGRVEAEQMKPSGARAVEAGSVAEAEALVSALGGSGNLLDIDACTTRLRLRVASQEKVDEAALQALGAAGVLRPSKDTVQVIIGLRADEIAGNMRRVGVDPVARVLEAVGGPANLESVEAFGTRLSMQLRDPSRVHPAALQGGGFRGLVEIAAARFHLLADSDTVELALALKAQPGPTR
jgi:PTS system N-acetylglucosamine-specific IIC component